MSSSSAAISAEDISASPAWLPLDAVGPGLMRLVRLDEAAYRAASFLDQRLLATNPTSAAVGTATVASAAARLAPGAHYIFHIGHVGSTLVSRLIGEFDGLFCVREPAILRETALPARRPESRGLGAARSTNPQRTEARTMSFRSTESDRADLRDPLSLLARTWRPTQRAVVKATSFVSEIAESILEIDPSSTAVLMFTPAPAYLRCILGGPNSRVESRALAPARLARLRARFGAVGAAGALGAVALDAALESEGQWIAMSWLCEMACLQQAARRFASRVLWVDFDGFLATPRAGLQEILQALGAAAEPSHIDAILAGPLLHRYSKAPEHAYDAALRQQVLACAEREHAAQIRRGMAWLEALAGRNPLVSEILAVKTAR